MEQHSFENQETLRQENNNQSPRVNSEKKPHLSKGVRILPRRGIDTTWSRQFTQNFTTDVATDQEFVANCIVVWDTATVWLFFRRPATTFYLFDS